MHKEIHLSETRGPLCIVRRAVLHHAKETHPAQTALRITAALAAALLVTAASDQHQTAQSPISNLNFTHQTSENFVNQP